MIVDALLLIVFAYAIFMGYRKGFIVQLAALFALILGVWGAIKFSHYLVDWLTQKFNSDSEYLSIISFAIVFLIIVILVHWVARLTENLAKAVALGMINRLFGVLFSTLKYVLILSVLMGIMNGIQMRSQLFPKTLLKESHLYYPISKIAPAIFPYLHFDWQIPEKYIPKVNGEIMV